MSCDYCRGARDGTALATMICPTTAGVIQRTFKVCDTCSELVARDLDAAQQLINRVINALN